MTGYIKGSRKHNILKKAIHKTSKSDYSASKWLNIGVFLEESWGENWPERFSNGVGIKISEYPQRVLMYGSSHQKSSWGELGCPERFPKKLAIFLGLFFLLPFSAKIQGFFTYQTMHITQGREEIGNSFQKKRFWIFEIFCLKTPILVKIAFWAKWRPGSKLFDVFLLESENIGPDKVFKPLFRGVFFRHYFISKIDKVFLTVQITVWGTSSRCTRKSHFNDPP